MADLKPLTQIQQELRAAYEPHFQERGPAVALLMLVAVERAIADLDPHVARPEAQTCSCQIDAHDFGCPKHGAPVFSRRSN